MSLEKNRQKIQKKIIKIESNIAFFENILLTLSFCIMILLGAGQVFLRNFFNTGIEWGDILVRALVLWVGFIGASLATRRSRHINIDIFSKLITSKKILKYRNQFINVTSLFISVLLFKASLDFIIMEVNNNITAFLNVPTWLIFIIVPISLFIMCIRLLMIIILNTKLEDDLI